MERRIAVTRLEIIATELVETGRKLKTKAVFFKEDTLAMKNIEKALTEVLRAQKHLREKGV